ncbi:RSPO3 protein, partial [Polyodon spathula]|nr:RSPO3 protein [Polyodon spathula]
MRQTGVCLSSCPSGYYGTRSPDINKCTKCKADCDACFNRNFCTKCKAGFYVHMGRCLDTCPDEYEPKEQHMECTAIVHCEVGEWSLWSPCSKRGKTCGFKRGEESRTRETLRIPSASGDTCPATKEKRKCVVQRRRCRKGGGKLWRGAPGHRCGSGSSTSPSYPVTGSSPEDAKQRATPGDSKQQVGAASSPSMVVEVEPAVIHPLLMEVVEACSLLATEVGAACSLLAREVRAACSLPLLQETGVALPHLRGTGAALPLIPERWCLFSARLCREDSAQGVVLALWRQLLVLFPACGGGGTSRHSPSAGGGRNSRHSSTVLIMGCGPGGSPLLGCGHSASSLLGCGRLCSCPSGCGCETSRHSPSAGGDGSNGSSPSDAGNGSDGSSPSGTTDVNALRPPKTSTVNGNFEVAQRRPKAGSVSVKGV